MLSVLFVCTGNQYRSPLAAACFRMKLQELGEVDNYVVGSAGTWVIPGLSAPIKLMQFAHLHGIDLGAHVTREVDEALLSLQDVILVMEKGHREALMTEFPSAAARIFMLSEAIDKIAYDIADPAKDMGSFEKIAFDLMDLIGRGHQDICRLATAGGQTVRDVKK